jgi:hypothetical protein
MIPNPFWFATNIIYNTITIYQKAQFNKHSQHTTFRPSYIRSNLL